MTELCRKILICGLLTYLGKTKNNDEVDFITPQTYQNISTYQITQ